MALAILLAPLGAGCRVAQSAAELPGQAVRAVTPGRDAQAKIDPVEIQQKLLRFASEFTVRLAMGLTALERGTGKPERIDALRLKMSLGSEVTAIASGSNSIAAVVDMVVLVSVTHLGLRAHASGLAASEAAAPLLEGVARSEREVWQLAERALTGEQLEELRKSIDLWREQTPNPIDFLSERAPGLSAEIATVSPKDTSRPESVFSLLRVDPLAGMDPAVREIAKTRLFAERALFVTQQLPTLLRWQAELFALNALSEPEVGELLATASAISATLAHAVAVAEKLPAQISAERQAILAALEAQEAALSPLAAEVKQTLDSGEAMSTALNETLRTFDALMARFGVGEPRRTEPIPEPGPEPGPEAGPEAGAKKGPPFRVLDYAETAEQVAATAREVTGLLQALDAALASQNLAALSSQVQPTVQQAQASGKELVDYAFLRAVLLVAAVLAAALVYRIVAVRLASARAG